MEKISADEKTCQRCLALAMMKKINFRILNDIPTHLLKFNLKETLSMGDISNTSQVVLEAELYDN